MANYLCNYLCKKFSRYTLTVSHNTSITDYGRTIMTTAGPLLKYGRLKSGMFSAHSVHLFYTSVICSHFVTYASLFSLLADRACVLKLIIYVLS